MHNSNVVFLLGNGEKLVCQRGYEGKSLLLSTDGFTVKGLLFVDIVLFAKGASPSCDSDRHARIITPL